MQQLRTSGSQIRHGRRLTQPSMMHCCVRSRQRVTMPYRRHTQGGSGHLWHLACASLEEAVGDAEAPVPGMRRPRGGSGGMQRPLPGMRWPRGGSGGMQTRPLLGMHMPGGSGGMWEPLPGKRRPRGGSGGMWGPLLGMRRPGGGSRGMQRPLPSMRRQWEDAEAMIPMRPSFSLSISLSPFSQAHDDLHVANLWRWYGPI